MRHLHTVKIVIEKVSQHFDRMAETVTGVKLIVPNRFLFKLVGPKTCKLHRVKG
ncbi:Uncharacterised protein [Vibrio cholerae]|nr:Uncharacterised protein [Vibrio cholerae]